MTLGGALNLFEKDKLSAQVTYGEGVARYINDLSGENIDAALDGGRLEAIPVFAAMAGYTHHWSEHWRSTVSGGYVHADAPDVARPLHHRQHDLRQREPHVAPDHIRSAWASNISTAARKPSTAPSATRTASTSSSATTSCGEPC